MYIGDAGGAGSPLLGELEGCLVVEISGGMYELDKLIHQKV